MAAHAPSSPLLPWPRPAPLLLLLALLAASYLALARLPAAAPLSALPPVPPRGEPTSSSCAGFYAGAGAARAVSASVEDFGAVGDGVTSNTAAFRRAVAELDERAARGGGGRGARLEVPPGRWLTGSFNLTSRFTLFLHHGAVILGSQVHPFHPYNSLIRFVFLLCNKNIATATSGLRIFAFQLSVQPNACCVHTAAQLLWIITLQFHSSVQ
jgi:hypothetical protein